MKESTDPLQRLAALVDRLRGPEGCPWDREQGLDDLRAYLLEEAHEVAAAIDSGDPDDLFEELGDLLFQIVFVSRLAADEWGFDLSRIVEKIEAKMIERHPHVFGGERLADAAAVRQAWERRKLESTGSQISLLAGVPESLPALLAAYRLTQKAAGVGFDWSDPLSVVDKTEEELAELRDELSSQSPKARDSVGAELGDLLFTLANLARHLDIDPEASLARANLKFRRRFALMETAAAAGGTTIADLSPEQREALWQRAKQDESD